MAHTATAVAKKVYVFGGVVGRGDDHGLDNDIDNEDDAVHVLDTGRWPPLADPHPNFAVP